MFSYSEKIKCIKEDKPVLIYFLWTMFLDLDSTLNLKKICVWLAKLKYDILHEYL